MQSYYVSRSLWAVAGVLAATLSLLPRRAQTQPAELDRGGSRPRVVILGGGTSHDFQQNYRRMDAATLRDAGMTVEYTERFDDLSTRLRGAMTVLQASNQAVFDAGTRKTLMHFIAQGGGLVAVHAGTWYNWADWPEYNRLLIGGGTRDHDKPGRFTVTGIAPQNPVMAGVPALFDIEDELYHQEMAADGPPVEVLATAYSPVTGKSYPSVWLVRGQAGRIVCIALGHDTRSHGNAAYQTILKNAVEWTASKSPVSSRH